MGLRKRTGKVVFHKNMEPTESVLERFEVPPDEYAADVNQLVQRHGSVQIDWDIGAPDAEPVITVTRNIATEPLRVVSRRLYRKKPPRKRKRKLNMLQFARDFCSMTREAFTGVGAPPLPLPREVWLPDGRGVDMAAGTCLVCGRRIVTPYTQDGPCLCSHRQPAQPLRYLHAGYHKPR